MRRRRFKAYGADWHAFASAVPAGTAQPDQPRHHCWAGWPVAQAAGPGAMAAAVTVIFQARGRRPTPKKLPLRIEPRYLPRGEWSATARTSAQ